MSPGVLPGESASTMTPAEREARWALSVRFAIEAASEAEARAILGQVLASFDRELPVQGEPTITPLGRRDGIWVATLMPDLTCWSRLSPMTRGIVAAMSPVTSVWAWAGCLAIPTVRRGGTGHRISGRGPPTMMSFCTRRCEP